MKKLILAIMIWCLAALGIAHSQIIDPVQWDASVKRISNQEVEVILKAQVDDGWDLYTQFFEEGGPMRMEFAFAPEDKILLMGKTTEHPKPKEKFDEIFQVDIQYLQHQAEFRQKLKLNSSEPFTLTATVSYQVCSSTSCIPFDKDFELKIVGSAKTTAPKPEQTEQAAITTPSSQKLAEPTETISTTDTSVKSLITPVTIQPIGSADVTAKLDETNAKEPTNSASPLGEDSSLWAVFWFSLLAGFIAILTPCVFPMIPMTVTFFMHSDNNKTKAKLQAAFYGFSIIAIYTIVGTIVAVTLGANFANWLSTHWIPNVLFFIIFMIFAASFLGMFEIVLPSSIVNKADRQADRGGFAGAFFMAFTLVLVSFSCTGPIVGAILVKSAGGEVLEPIVGMFGFSLAFAMPFTLFAIFPSWLNNLPKSGGWLNSVKVVLGFVELALGLKFLSVADQTYHWGILDREIYLALWITIFSLLGLYLLGKLKFSHDSETKYLPVPRLLMAIITFGFVVYLIPGMFGAPLKALSGYLPPESTQDFDIRTIVRNNSAPGDRHQSTSLCDKPKYADLLHLPHGLEGYFDYEQGLQCAKEQNKPVFIDFTGHGCVNCRQMEATVWSDPKVLDLLREEYIIVALYVDDKTKLPDNEWVTSTYDGKVKKTIGKKYADFQTSKFKINAQPYYVLLDTEGEMLVQPRAYDLNVDGFVSFLEQGVKNFKAQH